MAQPTDQEIQKARMDDELNRPLNGEDRLRLYAEGTGDFDFDEDDAAFCVDLIDAFRAAAGHRETAQSFNGKEDRHPRAPLMADNPHPADKHNQLARDFVMKAGRETNSAAEVMVVLESAILAGLLLLMKVHNMTPAVSNEMVESAVHRAIERFVAIDGNHAHG